MGRPLKDVDTEVLFDLIESGVAKKDIADELGLSVPTLSKRMADLQSKQGILLQYRSLQNLQLTELQAQILEKITPNKIEEASLRDLVFAYKVLKERELVEVGKPTELKGLVHYLIELEKQEMAVREPIDADSDDFEDAEYAVTEDGEILPKL